MHLGFLTVCLGNIPLKEKAKWASENGFKALEVACWPRGNDRDYSSSDIDVANLTPAEAETIKAYFKEYGLTISSLAYYDNNLHKDPETRAYINNHVKKCIGAAALLGTPLVGTFVGRNSDKDIVGNFEEYEKVFSDLVGYAESKGIKLMIENCDMLGWQQKGVPGTISYSPELWAEMFRRIPSKSFGINFDPSHLVHLLIDYVKAAEFIKDRIFHVHAKDTKLLPEKLDMYGIFDRQLFTGDEHDRFGFWKPRMPGYGDVDWGKFIAALKSFGYDGVISTEHEDPDYEGSESKVKEALLLGKAHLEKLI